MKNYWLVFVVALLCWSCKKTDSTPAPVSASVGGFGCPAAAVSGAVISGTAFTGTVTVPYTGGNGVAYNAGSAIASTGVAGLSATLQPKFDHLPV